MTDSTVEPPRSFNFADIWEMAAAALPDREALVVGQVRRTYGQLEERSNLLAIYFAERGVKPGDHIALYLANCAEYVEAMLAAFKLSAVPINVNHRYVAGELRSLLSGSDSVAVVTQPSLQPTVEEVLAGDDVPPMRFVLTTGDEYDAALTAGRATAGTTEVPRAERSGDDRYVIYTGGTTGLPKGVEWRQEDAFFACIGGGDPMRLEGPIEEPAELVGRLIEQPVCYMTLAPMMHAAAQWTAFSWLFCGGKVVLMPGSLDPRAVWQTVEAERVQVMTGVGDAMFRPLLAAWGELVCEGVAPDVSSLFVLSNGGAPLAAVTKQRAFEAFPDVMLNDGFGSSEAGVQGASRLSAADAPSSGSVVTFDRPAKPTIVVDPLGDEVKPGSGVVGQVLAGGRLPLGYYNDPVMTAANFIERDGERWLITGDMATVEADGAISLVGRGSGVINTGGEKVYPEEVEGVLKAHEAVYDCLVVGVPDERWGSAVAAIVQPVAPVTLEELVRHSKNELASYKAPKRLVIVEEIVRSPSGKADYRWARSAAESLSEKQTS